MVRKQQVSGRIAIVTGAGRRQGIGAAVCQALARSGAHIFFTSWTTYDRRMPWGAEEHEPDNLRKEIRAGRSL